GRHHAGRQAGPDDWRGGCRRPAVTQHADGPTSGGMKTPSLMELVKLGALGAGLWLLWKLVNKGSDLAKGASSAIAAAWLKMFPLPGAIELLGYVRFPGNLRVPIQQLAKDI